jgi:hypothetical protein
VGVPLLVVAAAGTLALLAPGTREQLGIGLDE